MDVSFNKFLEENFASENNKFLINMRSLFDHGRLSEAQKLLILPVDQGFEHGPEKSFSPNPDAFDPHYHYKFAKRAGFNALCAPLGMLEATASLRKQEIHAANIAIKKALRSIGFSELDDESPVLAEDDFMIFAHKYEGILNDLAMNLGKPTSWEDFKIMMKNGYQTFASEVHSYLENSQRMGKETPFSENTIRAFYSTLISAQQDAVMDIFGNELDWTSGKNYHCWGEPLPTILKLNSSNYIDSSADSEPHQSMNSSVSDAVRLGCVGVGFTLYPGSKRFSDMLRELSAVISEARKHGLIVVVWAYPRGSNLEDDKKSRNSIDIATYAAHIACLMGAHIVKVKIPEDRVYWKSLKKSFPEEMSDAEVIRYVKRACLNGRRFVVFSGGEMSDDESLQNQIEAIKSGGGDGSMIGRNSFQRPFSEAKNLINKIISVYSRESR